MKWEIKQLGEFVTLKRGYDLPSHQREDGFVPIVSSSGISGYHNKAMADAPGVVTGRYGTLGDVFYLKENFWPLNTALYVRDFHGNDSLFVSYFLKYLLKGIKSDKAAVPGLNRNELHGIIVRVPPLSEQIHIAGYLSAYDDLIENNRRRMAKLEEAARLLYQEWFVRLRFPGHERTRIVNGVPEGWQRLAASDAIEVNPLTRLSPLSEQSARRHIEMADLSTSSMSISAHSFRAQSSGSKFMNGDTLFARITPCLENGKIGFVDFLEPGEVSTGSTEFIVLRSKLVCPEYVYCLARTDEFRENAIKSMIGSSGRQRVHASCFDKFMIMVPPDAVINQFIDCVRPLFAQVRNLFTQNEKLSAARDLLLPRLMSGEIAV